MTKITKSSPAREIFKGKRTGRLYDLFPKVEKYGKIRNTGIAYRVCSGRDTYTNSKIYDVEFLQVRDDGTIKHRVDLEQSLYNMKELESYLNYLQGKFSLSGKSKI